MAVRREQVAAALRYMQQLRDRANEFGVGVAKNLTERAQSAGGLAYEALTSDPNIGRMTTAEYAQAADRPTPRLDQTASELGTLGRAVLTQPIETGKTIVRSEVERARGALDSPQAAGEYAGSLIDPLRLASALRTKGPIAEIDVYHGSPHVFDEFDASKIGTGEGAQAYGHGIYLAESPKVAKEYATKLGRVVSSIDNNPTKDVYEEWAVSALKNFPEPEKAKAYFQNLVDVGLLKGKGSNEVRAYVSSVNDAIDKAAGKKVGQAIQGNLYTADLPDEMVDRMLDYDLPIDQQNPYVLAALDRAGINTKSSMLAGLMAQGQERHLAKFGIPGIKYLDEGSRGKSATKTRNFVVFPGEEKKVKILKRE